MDASAGTFQAHRSRLFGIAYRMLSSRADAEDMLQEAHLLWRGSDPSEVRNPEAWLDRNGNLASERPRAGRPLRARASAFHGRGLGESGDGRGRHQRLESSGDQPFERFRSPISLPIAEV